MTDSVFINTFDSVYGQRAMAQVTFMNLPQRNANVQLDSGRCDMFAAAYAWEQVTGCKLTREERELSVVETYGEHVAMSDAWVNRFVNGEDF